MKISKSLKIEDKFISKNNKLNTENAFIDAHTNLAVMYVVTGKDMQEALVLCEKAMGMNPDQFESYINFADILRKLDKREEAVKFTWESI